MNDDPLERLPAFNRISVRAVLDTGDGDVQAALAEAGIFDPVAVPVLLGDDALQAGAFLGDGMTPNLVGVLVPDTDDMAPNIRSAAGSEQADGAGPGRARRAHAVGWRSRAPVPAGVRNDGSG
jgi:hypothetical protein